MAIIIPAGFAHVLMPLRLPSQSRSSAITFGVDAGLIEDPSLLADSIQDSWFEHCAPQYDSSIIVGPTLCRVGVSDGEPVSGEATSATSGLANYDSPPPNVAVLIKKTTARGGRRGRGRLYLPWGVPETAINEAGAIDGSSLADIQSAWSDFALDLSTSLTPMVILHDSVGTTAPGQPDEITALTVQSVVATQRRRVRR